MMRHALLLFLFFTSSIVFAQSKNMYDYSFIGIEGDTISLATFKGKKILFVNVASKCGFTPQYSELQELHEKHGDKVVLIGFPCDQFLNQEPGTEKEIVEFCQKNYGVTFLMASKIDVKGKHQHPIYGWLTKKSLNGVEDSKVKWNFQKYLVDENGAFVRYWSSSVKPMSEEITTHFQ